jgi:hypothetical protein
MYGSRFINTSLLPECAKPGQNLDYLSEEKSPKAA